jgi:hypothetical protein
MAPTICSTIATPTVAAVAAGPEDVKLDSHTPITPSAAAPASA